LAVSEDGGLWIWDKSFLGSIPKPNREAGYPVRLGTDNGWSTIAAGRTGRIGIKREGTLWAWEDEVGRPAKQPEKFDSRTDWAEASISGQDYAIVRRSNGECYYPNVYFKDIELVDSDLWKTASISQSGIVRVRMDGTLWFRYSNQVMQLSSEMDWTAVACLRSSYMALRSDGTLWSAPMTGGLKGVRSPVAYPAPTRWAKIDPGYAVAGLISRDGSLWVRGTTFSRIAPAFSPQTLDFMAAREQPFPVVAGSILAVPEAALNSRLPVELSVVSGPAEIVGQGISFTGPGLVEVSFKQAGNATWGFFEERRTFLSGAPGPEIAVHDGTSATNPARREGGAVILLGNKTRSAMAAGLPRAFVIENTGTEPLRLSAVTAETAGPLTFTTPFVPVTVAPGGLVLLELTLRASEYGSHDLTVLLHSDDTDEPAYRIPFQLELANTPPEARTGPDRQIHAGQPMRLDGAFFSRDLEQDAVALTYEWDLGGNGYAAIGAMQEITLASPGQRLTAKLRVTDADGEVSYSECFISAVVPGTEIPTAIRVGADGFYDLVFHGVPGKKYRTYISYNLTSWEAVDSHQSPQPPPVICGEDGFFPVHAGLRYGERAFYRAQEVDE
jgi:hypothetical protein